LIHNKKNLFGKEPKELKCTKVEVKWGLTTPCSGLRRSQWRCLLHDEWDIPSWPTTSLDEDGEQWQWPLFVVSRISNVLLKLVD